MITTDFVPGSPCWLDLGAPDVGRSVDFYRTVFGWEAQSAGPEAGEYLLCRSNGKVVAAIGRLTEEGARSAWMIYFRVGDADAAASRVQELGGSVRVPPMGTGEEGRMAQFSDPLGGQFAVWQAGTQNGLEAVDQAGSLCWVEHYTSDENAAKSFYGALFDWKIEGMPMPGDESAATYWLITPAGLGDERMHGGLMQAPPEALAPADGRPYWHPVFAVDDTDDTVGRARGAGGNLLMGPVDAPGVGRIAMLTDPSGAQFVILKPSME